LEIGTGSGYQAAVLSPLVKDVYTIEIVKPLGERAAKTLAKLKYKNVHAKVGDGFQGWPEHAPFDKIIVTCSPEKVPPKLIEQLREGGRMIVPVGERYQQTLYLFHKQDGKLKKLALLPTLFVPMTGTAEADRVVKPDPAHPAINNGGFEQTETITKDTSERDSADSPPDKTADGKDKEEIVPLGWHYQRQLRLVEAADAPEGKHYVTFSNSEPGRNAYALQGLAVDGRKVHELNVSIWVKMSNVRPGPHPGQHPLVVILFYDENRAPAGQVWVGPWRDPVAWQKMVDKVAVPPKAREAIVRVGMNGATGEVSFDDLRIGAAE
jgi:protein-L-isoaspartate(D-aspartate) O-methyltransferase